MPNDSQKVMIFEKLQYYIESISTQAATQPAAKNCTEKILKTIKMIKSLYKKKNNLPENQENDEAVGQGRILELCYGRDGLIDFLELLFSQIPTKKDVKANFNFYYSLKR